MEVTYEKDLEAIEGREYEMEAEVQTQISSENAAMDQAFVA